MVCFRTKRRFQYSRFALDIGKTLSTTDLILTQKLSDWQMHHHLLQYCKALFLALLRTSGMVFCGFLVGHHCLLAATGITRELKTVAAKISLAFSFTPAPVKRNVEPRFSQQSGWSCHTEERAGSNFGKVRWYNNWLMLNLFFARAAVDSELVHKSIYKKIQSFISWGGVSAHLYFRKARYNKLIRILDRIIWLVKEDKSRQIFKQSKFTNWNSSAVRI